MQQSSRYIHREHSEGLRRTLQMGSQNSVRQSKLNDVMSSNWFKRSVDKVQDVEVQATKAEIERESGIAPERQENAAPIQVDRKESQLIISQPEEPSPSQTQERREFLPYDAQEEKSRSGFASSTANSETVSAESRVNYRNFKGILAPVFTCFKDDDRRSLDVRHIQHYAEWLHSQNILGVLINGVVGEGPTMGLKERKANCEYWHRAAKRNGLMCLVQVGGAPLPDVLHLASHAEEVGVSAVVTLPELFYRPRSVDQLVRYCQRVAGRCRSRPFFYYHIPSMTGVDLDMVEFCAKAEDLIPNFLGVHFSSNDLEMGQKCLRKGRVILLGSSSLLASAMMCGFRSINIGVVNVRPDLVNGIYDAVYHNDLKLARERQDELNHLVEIHTHRAYFENWVVVMKEWFNKEQTGRRFPTFSAGPARNPN